MVNFFYLSVREEVKKNMGQILDLKEIQARKEARDAAFSRLPTEQQTTIEKLAGELAAGLERAGKQTALEIIDSVGQSLSRLNYPQ